jgi:hypothetical protein
MNNINATIDWGDGQTSSGAWIPGSGSPEAGIGGSLAGPYTGFSGSPVGEPTDYEWSVPLGTNGDVVEFETEITSLSGQSLTSSASSEVTLPGSGGGTLPSSFVLTDQPSGTPSQLDLNWNYSLDNASGFVIDAVLAGSSGAPQTLDSVGGGTSSDQITIPQQDVGKALSIWVQALVGGVDGALSNEVTTGQSTTLTATFQSGRTGLPGTPNAAGLSIKWGGVPQYGSFDIIQHIVAAAAVYNADGKPDKTADDILNYKAYWEDWYVIAGKFTPNENEDDYKLINYDQTKVEPHILDNTYGWYLVNGWAQIVDVGANHIIPENERVDQAADLPATTQPPAGISDEGALHRTFLVWWDWLDNSKHEYTAEVATNPTWASSNPPGSPTTRPTTGP